MHWYDVAVGLPTARQLPAAHAAQAAVLPTGTAAPKKPAAQTLQLGDIDTALVLP
jgi:hypothetical protein